MRHKAIRVDNLMYQGCEPHWKCVNCGEAVPFHCYSKEEFEQRCCGCHKIRCNDCQDKFLNNVYASLEAADFELD